MQPKEEEEANSGGRAAQYERRSSDSRKVYAQAGLLAGRLAGSARENAIVKAVLLSCLHSISAPLHREQRRAVSLF